MIREDIAAKSFQYSHVKRKAPTKGVATRALATAHLKAQRIIHLTRLYRHNRLKLVQLGADNAALSTFKELTPTDVKASTAVMDPNQHHSKQLELSWIWQMDAEGGANSPAGLLEFQRIHYLRARANRLRWTEELSYASHEMEWTIRFYLHHANVWQQRSDNQAEEGNAGAVSYALRKSAMWKELVPLAENQFRKANPNYRSPYL
ncbi:hypothetical protein BDN70DRAFT_821165 [Pholiota conissans]|uniref:Uncharacterized protein n=1 Tax=Pholiota conissans TaxID=109636 RepID=A0A9P5YK48_9AGAR|nr:hypothetical protein BDN70DRAFT_821165 [Pholiota conissans]